MRSATPAILLAGVNLAECLRGLSEGESPRELDHGVVDHIPLRRHRRRPSRAPAEATAAAAGDIPDNQAFIVFA